MSQQSVAFTNSLAVCGSFTNIYNEALDKWIAPLHFTLLQAQRTFYSISSHCSHSNSEHIMCHTIFCQPSLLSCQTKMIENLPSRDTCPSLYFCLRCERYGFPRHSIFRMKNLFCSAMLCPFQHSTASKRCLLETKHCHAGCMFSCILRP